MRLSRVAPEWSHLRVKFDQAVYGVVLGIRNGKKIGVMHADMAACRRMHKAIQEKLKHYGASGTLKWRIEMIPGRDDSPVDILYWIERWPKKDKNAAKV